MVYGEQVNLHLAVQIHSQPHHSPSHGACRHQGAGIGALRYRTRWLSLCHMVVMVLHVFVQDVLDQYLFHFQPRLEPPVRHLAVVNTFHDVVQKRDDLRMLLCMLFRVRTAPLLECCLLMGEVHRRIIQNGSHTAFDLLLIHAPDDGLVQFVDKSDEVLVLGIYLRDVHT